MGNKDKMELQITSAISNLQTDDQQRVLDTIAQVRKCGLAGTLSLPQIVCCGDQSAGKSSVLEALTEIPFPRSDNLCTRFATEIIMRRASSDSLIIKIIPDSQRPPNEKTLLEKFEATIADFSQLPEIMKLAMDAMDLSSDVGAQSGSSTPRAFSKDVMSVVIEGPSRPQLTVVDLPGLIASTTRGVTKFDVKMVTDITEHYIKQSRTICVACVSASTDYANQRILQKVREVDPTGDRTLGLITKPDRLPAGSGSEKAYVSLAQNEDVFFKLGWHVLKNRSFEESECSLAERDVSEADYFQTSSFKAVQPDCLGIDALRQRLSVLLFNHVKLELPNLFEDLQRALYQAQNQLGVLGNRRLSIPECKHYLANLSMSVHDITKAAVEGHWEGEYFNVAHAGDFGPQSAESFRRLRANVQHINQKFSDDMRLRAHKFDLTFKAAPTLDVPKAGDPAQTQASSLESASTTVEAPIKLSKNKAFEWIDKAVKRTRGKELIGSFNSLLVGELLWEQSSKWQEVAERYIDDVSELCHRFLRTVLADKCPKDIQAKLWRSHVEDVLKSRTEAAQDELKKILAEVANYPINYNHYYTDTVTERRQKRLEEAFSKVIKESTKYDSSNNGFATRPTIDVAMVSQRLLRPDPDLDSFANEDALDSLLAIYKVTRKVFVANVTVQVGERHLIRGLETIFSPLTFLDMGDAEVEALAAESPSTQRRRVHLEDQVKKLKAGQRIFRGIMSGVTK
ncbi:MAG: hypothetical protein M1814_001700 [Vezdaea aestivalis]|nr:MAG: hypothetical protein M1814_001700 [Vezdaea aestivalis]